MKQISKIQRNILEIAKEFFISSSDFNGILAYSLMNMIKIDLVTLQSALAQMIKKGLITVVFSSYQDNPHIKRLKDLSIDNQLKKLFIDLPNTYCIYPTKNTLLDRSDIARFADYPFSLQLALAEPQLRPMFFVLEVLETYCNDPRYHFHFNDFSGSISVDSNDGSSEILASNNIFLQTFGIAYNSKRYRVVVVYLRYLAQLTLEHQKIWEARRITETCVINSDYENATLYGAFPQFYSAYQAFLVEQEEINKLSVLIQKPHLFREVFVDNRPEGFNPLFNPTKRNFNDFIHLLDKMISDNINQDFFANDIPLNEEIFRGENRVQIQSLGTLTLLKNWISDQYRTSDGLDISEQVIKPFQFIRKLRQEPAHKIKKNEYDVKYWINQNAIMADVIRSMQTLRYILSSHPLAQKYEPPKWLDSNKIVFY